MKPEGASTVHLGASHASMLDAMHAHFPRIGRETWRERFRHGRVLDANGEALAAEAPARAGQCVRYFREVPDEPRIEGGERVLHVDDDLVVADKPALLPVMPAGRFVRETLLTRLRERLDNPDLVPLHRIDRDTSGLVLFSARPASRAAYARLFAERRIDKGYEALVEAPALPELPAERRSRIVRGEPFFRMHEVAGEANAHTRIHVLARRGPCVHVRLEPVTGRKHQLRVHMAALGAPILNDRLYPALDEGRPDDPRRPLALLARTLEFVDPRSSRVRRFQSTRDVRTLASAADGPDMDRQ